MDSTAESKKLTSAVTTLRASLDEMRKATDAGEVEIGFSAIRRQVGTALLETKDVKVLGLLRGLYRAVDREVYENQTKRTQHQDTLEIYIAELTASACQGPYVRDSITNRTRVYVSNDDTISAMFDELCRRCNLPTKRISLDQLTDHALALRRDIAEFPLKQHQAFCRGEGIEKLIRERVRKYDACYVLYRSSTEAGTTSTEKVPDNIVREASHNYCVVHFYNQSSLPLGNRTREKWEEHKWVKRIIQVCYTSEEGKERLRADDEDPDMRNAKAYADIRAVAVGQCATQVMICPDPLHAPYDRCKDPLIPDDGIQNEPDPEPEEKTD